MKTTRSDTSPGTSSTTANDGYVVRTSYRITDVGSWDKTVEIVREQSVDEAAVTEEAMLEGVRTTMVYRNYTENAVQALRQQFLVDGELPVGVTFEARKTDGNLYDVTVRQTDGDERELVRRCSLSALEHRTVVQKTSPQDIPDDTTHADEVNPAARTWKELDYAVQSTGVWQRTDTEHLLIRHEWDAEVCMELCYSYDVWFRNDTFDEYHDLLRRVQTYLVKCVRGWTDAGRPPAGYSCNPDVHINDGQLYDGHIAIRAEWAAGSAGMTGETEGIEMAVTYAGTYNAGIHAMGRGIETLQKVLTAYSETDFADEDHAYGVRHTASFDWRPSAGTWSATVDVSAVSKHEGLGGVHLITDPSVRRLQHTVSEAVEPSGKPVLVI